jgi:hypothetical protein
LQIEYFLDPLFRQSQHFIELGFAVGGSFGRPLHLNEIAPPGHHHIHIHFGPGVLNILQVQHGFTVHNTYADSGYVINDGQLLYNTFRLKFHQSQAQGYESPAY